MRKTLPIFYNAILLTAVNLLLRFVSTSFQVHISSTIGPEGVGLLQLVLSISGLALTVGMAGIRTATMYLTAEELGKNRPQNISYILRSCFIYSILCSGFVTISIYCLAPWLAQNWVGNTDTTTAIRIYATFLPTICLCGCMTGYFTAANKIVTLAGIEILEQLCYMIVTILILYLYAVNDSKRACEAVVFGSGISSCLTLFLLICIRIHHRYPNTKRIPVASRLANIAIPLALADNLKTGISTTENLMVPKRLALFPGATSPLGTFGTVVGMVFPILMFPCAILYALAELLIPEFAKCKAGDNEVRIRYLARRTLHVAMLYGFLCGGILYLIAIPLCKSIYGNSNAGKHLQMYSLLAPLLYTDAITDATIKGLGQQKANVKYNILSSALDVILLYMLLPRYGMLGYYISFIVTHLLNFILSIRRLIKTSGIIFPLWIPFNTLSAWFLALTGASLISYTPVKTIIFVLLYGSLLAILGVVKRKDIFWIKNLIHNKHPK